MIRMFSKPVRVGAGARIRRRVALFCAVVVVFAACRREPRAAVDGPNAVAAPIASLRPDVLRGFCYAHTYEDQGSHGYGTESSRQAKLEARRLGTQWLSLTPFAFVPNRTASRVLLIKDMMQRADAKRSFEKSNAKAETDDIVINEIEQARELGFKIQLKPHLWMLDGSWRGQLDPGTAEAWLKFWQSYRRFIFHYADMAQAHRVEMLVVGVELDQTVVAHADQWRQLIRDVRARYDGQLVYASNWDAYDRVPFWPALDFVGVQFYPPLATEPGATPSSMMQRLDRALDGLDEIAQKTKRRVLLTEVGYRAVTGTEIHPHEWPDPNARQVDAGAQARAYRVLLNGIRDRDQVAGIFLWKWYTDEDGDEGPAGFSPRGKPAADLIRQAFRQP